MTLTLRPTLATTGLAELDEVCSLDVGTVNLFIAAEGCGLTGAAYAHTLASAARVAGEDPRAKVLLVTAEEPGQVRADLELDRRNASLADTILIRRATTVSELMGAFLQSRAKADSLPVVLVADLNLITRSDAGAGATVIKAIAEFGSCVLAYNQTRTLPDRVRYFEDGDDPTLFSRGWDVFPGDLRLPTVHEVAGRADLTYVSESIVVLHRSRVRSNPAVGGRLTDTRARAVVAKSRRHNGSQVVELRFDVNPHGRGGRYLSA